MGLAFVTTTVVRTMNLFWCFLTDWPKHLPVMVCLRPTLIQARPSNGVFAHTLAKHATPYEACTHTLVGAHTNLNLLLLNMLGPAKLQKGCDWNILRPHPVAKKSCRGM